MGVKQICQKKKCGNNKFWIENRSIIEKKKKTLEARTRFVDMSVCTACGKVYHGAQ